MTKGKEGVSVAQATEELAAGGAAFSAGDVARRAGVTRQAAYAHLSKLVAAGRARREGAGRGTRYTRSWDFHRVYPISGLDESAVWTEVQAELPQLARVPSNVRNVVGYCFTEMLNNAIDHSTGVDAAATIWLTGDALTVEIVDDGIGVFRRIREEWSLPDDLASIAELSKGKRTTFPERHSGEGIFFTSKAVDHFELASGGYRWRVDNTRRDMAVGESTTRRGTLVRFDVDTSVDRSLAAVFAPYTNVDTEFDRSEIVVHLLEAGAAFLSRSEAKRLAAGLDQFRVVTLDFRGVEDVGQGFVDELFRVWSREHPNTRFVPINMNEGVRFMVERGLPGNQSRS